MPQVTVVLPTGLTRTFNVAKEKVVLGRGAECDISIDSPAVSRVHAEISRNGEGWRIRDLDSLNGIWARGARVADTALHDGDEVVLGDTYVYVGTPVADQPTVLIEDRESYWLDPNLRRLFHGERRVGDPLSPMEYRLVQILLDARGVLVERPVIERALWGRDFYDQSSLHHLVRQVRKRLHDSTAEPSLVINVPGVGYRFDTDGRCPTGHGRGR